MNPSKTQNSLRLLAHSSADVIVITTSMTFSHESAVVFAQWPQNWPLCLCKGLQQQMIDRCQCPIWRNNWSRWKDEEMNFNLPLLTESWAPRSPSLQGGVSGAAVITADLMIFSCFKQQLVFFKHETIISTKTWSLWLLLAAYVMWFKPNLKAVEPGQTHKWANKIKNDSPQSFQPMIPNHCHSDER